MWPIREFVLLPIIWILCGRISIECWDTLHIQTMPFAIPCFQQTTLAAYRFLAKKCAEEMEKDGTRHCQYIPMAVLIYFK